LFVWHDDAEALLRFVPLEGDDEVVDEEDEGLASDGDMSGFSAEF